MYFLIVSGMSGAGKSRTMAILEDLGFYCVDNMPIQLIPKFAEVCMAGVEQYKKVALVTDVRARTDFNNLSSALESVKMLGCDYKVLFLDTTTPILINRYKETRRKHPLVEAGMPMSEAISKERSLLEEIKSKADFVVDTTNLSIKKLREKIITLFMDNKQGIFEVNVMSFGFKYGIPTESDLVFDVRFLPNPYYEEELREYNGTNQAVRDYVFSDGMADAFMQKLNDLVDFLIPKYIEEGKASISIGIGCTGGKHRSVAITEELTAHIKNNGYNSVSTHRDYKRG